MIRIILFYLLAAVCLGAAKEADVCYGELGCFTSDYPWGGTAERPNEYVPEHPDTVGTRFYLDTRHQLDEEVSNTNMLDLKRTSFDNSKPTRFVVHGYVQNGDTNWMNAISEELLIVEDCNVIRVGWFAGSLDINYARSATNIQVVAAEMTYLILQIEENIGKMGEIYCIGHSLGAQTCGYVGADDRFVLERITGLDPAGPYFEGTPFEIRLDSTDAIFVDVIHSDAQKLAPNLGMGTNDVSGHVDFWPNNGIEQPGCDQNALSTIVGEDGIVEGTRNFVACNHLRATGLFVESIRSGCGFVANPCTSYANYLDGHCNTCPQGICASMGFQSILSKDMIMSSSQPNFYLATDSFKPYCQEMVYVDVILGTESDGIKGTLYLALYGRNEQATELAPLFEEKEELDLRPGNVYHYAAHFGEIPQDFYYVKFLWEQNEYTLNAQHMAIDRIKLWVNGEQATQEFCGDQTVKVREKERLVVTRC